MIGSKWLGTVEPEFKNECRYSTPNGNGIAATEADAKLRVEEEYNTKNQ